MQRFKSLLYSRLPVLAAVVMVAATLTVIRHLRGSLTEAWRFFGIPALTPLFADTRTITHSIDCLLSGQNPFFVRSFDPWGRVYNYPPIWLDLRYLGVTSHSSYLLGSIATAMTIAAMLLIFEVRTFISALLVFFAVVSSAVLFGVERGNCDLVVFSLLVYGFFLAERTGTRAQPLLRGLVIIVLTVLKIYPFVMVTSLLERRKSLILAGGTVLLSLAALVATSHGTLPLVLANTPQESFASYGAYPALFYISTHTGPALRERLQTNHSFATFAATLLAVASVMLAIFRRRQLGRFLPPLDLQTARGGIAAAGLTVFCFTFMRGSSFNYRLIFLTGVVAYLARDIDRRQTLRSLPAAVLFVLLLSSPLTRMMLWGQALGVAAFVLSSGWLSVTLLGNLELLPGSGEIEQAERSVHPLAAGSV